LTFGTQMEGKLGKLQSLHFAISEAETSASDERKFFIVLFHARNNQLVFVPLWCN
jgi:hypothetical protein